MTTNDDARSEQLATLQAALAGTWSLERELGRGGMATVYLARDVALERPVAIKVLDPALALDPVQRERFLREARTGARLTHPHIVPIYAVDEAAESVFIVMGLVDGESLAERLHRDGPLTTADAVRLLREVGWALGYAHATGILHRDVTLDNILIDRRTGRAMLADFGIAAAIDREAAGPLLGTPAYLAPELIQGEPASPASDLYALGVMAWAALAGRLPFHGDDQGATLLLHLTQPVPSLADAAPGASATLVRAVESCLQKNPALRPHSVEAWLTTLDTRSRAIAVATPVERWVDQWTQVRAFYALAMSMTAMWGSISLIGILYSISSADGWTLLIMLLLFFGGLTLAGAGMVHRIVAGRLLRGVIRAGYGIEDLRLALRRAARRDEEEQLKPEPLLHRLAFRATRIAALFIVISCLIILAIGMAGLDDFGRLTEIILDPERAWRVAYAVFWLGLSMQVLLPGPRSRLRRWTNALRLAYWHSPLGAFSLRAAGAGLVRRAAPEETLHRPTELMLDLAIEDLWRELPAASRQRLPEVPALARSLRERLAKLREVRQQLDAPDLIRSREARQLRDALALRQEAGVTALERLRLLVARLGGTIPTEDELTLPLALAREADRDLLEALGAHHDLHRRLRHGITPMTPAMTPAG